MWAAAAVAKGRKVASSVYAMVVPGSGHVKAQAEEEGPDKIFTEAGFDYAEPGSMCLAMNGDMLHQGKDRFTSNRNFEGDNLVGDYLVIAMAAAAIAAI